jgi:hypothetical protein
VNRSPRKGAPVVSRIECPIDERIPKTITPEGLRRRAPGRS